MIGLIDALHCILMFSIVQHDLLAACIMHKALALSAVPVCPSALQSPYSLSRVLGELS